MKVQFSCFINQQGGKCKPCQHCQDEQGLVKKMSGYPEGSPALCHKCWMLLCKKDWATVCACAEGCAEIAKSLGLASSGSGTGTSSVEPTSFSQRSPSSPPLPTRWSQSSLSPYTTLLFCRLQSSLAEVFASHMTGRIAHIALFGSVLAGLDDPQSDLDILCFFPNGKDLDPQ